MALQTANRAVYLFVHETGVAVVVKAESKSQAIGRLAGVMHAKDTHVWSSLAADYRSDIDAGVWQVINGQNLLFDR